MAALIEAAKAPDYPAEIALVVSNVPQAAGLLRAQDEAIATAVLDHSTFEDKRSFEAALDDLLKVQRIEIVALAGFMRILGAPFCERWAGRLINIHPSLLPNFKGLHTHERALSAGVAEHGCTVHHVTAGMDEGPIIDQARVPVLLGDTADTLAARVLVEEHKLYPEALARIARTLC